MAAVIKTKDLKCSKLFSRNYSNSIDFDESSANEVELIFNELNNKKFKLNLDFETKFIKWHNVPLLL